MSEFKGTKGEWCVIRMDDTFIETSEGNVCEIPHNGIYNYDELPYNALLISKAPEMLEMLKECMRVLSSVQSPATPSILLYREIKELIKQATEL